MQAIDRDREVLKRIVALLLSLAGIAEQAADAALPVRVRVIAILRQALGVALGCIAGVAQDFGRATPQACLATPPSTSALAGHEPGAARRLALCLRALAMALAFMLLAAGCFVRRRIFHPARRLSVPSGWTSKAAFADTS